MGTLLGIDNSDTRSTWRKKNICTICAKMEWIQTNHRYIVFCMKVMH